MNTRGFNTYFYFIVTIYKIRGGHRLAGRGVIGRCGEVRYMGACDVEGPPIDGAYIIQSYMSYLRHLQGLNK